MIFSIKSTIQYRQYSNGQEWNNEAAYYRGCGISLKIQLIRFLLFCYVILMFLECRDEALINGANPIRDNQLTASSVNPECSVSRSRLFTQKTSRKSHPYGGAWCMYGPPTTLSWIQVRTRKND